MPRPLEQVSFLLHEYRLLVNRRWGRLWTVLFSEGFVAIAFYRLERALFLALGPAWPVARGALAPLFFLMRPWAGHADIHYGADLGRGLRILHPAAGVVVSRGVIAGQDLVLTGGNIVGGRRSLSPGEVLVGAGVTLGANAVVLGPLTIGDRVTVSASSLVVRNVNDDETVAGVPARLLFKTTGGQAGPAAGSTPTRSRAPQ